MSAPAQLTINEAAETLRNLAQALRRAERTSLRRPALNTILVRDNHTHRWHIDPTRLIRAMLTEDTDQALLASLETQTGGTLEFTVEATPNDNFNKPTETGTYHIDLCLTFTGNVTLRTPLSTVSNIVQNGFPHNKPLAQLAHFDTEGTCETTIDVDPTGQPIAITCTRHGRYQAN